jgi:DNA-directed RNA polymerase specialized sigma24 family protein
LPVPIDRAQEAISSQAAREVLVDGPVPQPPLSSGSVTNWFLALQGGNQEGAQKLWDRFSQRLLGLARKKLEDAPRRAADEEDVALSAFFSFCRGAEKGRFTQLQDRDDLWRLLVVITVRKAIDLHHHENRLKRGGPAAPQAGAPQLDDLLGREPTPELAAVMAEECGRLMSQLGDAELRSIALLKMEGYTDDEIGRQLGCARRTVQRRLRLIRQLWEREAA